MAVLLKCGKYSLRHMEEGDWKPKLKGRDFGYVTFVLEYENEQVGAVAGDIDDIYGIETRPQGKGHGTKFIKMMMKVAKGRGKTTFKVQSVDCVELEYILRDKLGFEQIDGENGTWMKRLDA